MNEQEKTGFEKWLQSSYFSQDWKNTISKTIDIVGTAGQIVGGVMTVVGIVGAIIKLVDFLHFTQPGEDPLELLASEVRDLENLMLALFVWNSDADWNAVLADLDTAAQGLREFIIDARVPTASRPGLLDDAARDEIHSTLLVMLRDVVNRLLPSPGSGPLAFQEALNTTPTIADELDMLAANKQYCKKAGAAGLGIGDLPNVDPIEGPEVPKDGLVWDYQRALPHILRALVQLLACFKVYDPAFRTTRRFEDDINQIADNLDIFAARWLECIYWSNDYPVDPNFSPDDFPEASFPTALDTRSRVAISHATEHPEVDHWAPMPADPEYSRRRLEYGQKVMTYSGFNDFRDFINQFRSLVSLPGNSESVETRAQILGARSFLRTEQVRIGPTQRSVRVYHVDWNVAIELTVQPKSAPYDYARDRPIRYEFFLESYEQGPTTADGSPLMGEEPRGLVQQVRLQPSLNNQIDIRVYSSDLFVPAGDPGPAGTAAKYDPGLTRAPATNVLSGMSIAEFLNDVVSLTPALRPDVSNRFLNDMAKISVIVGDWTWAEGPPPGAFFGSPSLAETTLGYTLVFGPHDDIRDGFVSFRCWNIEGHDVNVGALYLVVEETPPLDPETKFRTYLPVPINPTEMWYPAYVHRTVYPPPQMT